jgi:hypothetical protein
VLAVRGVVHVDTPDVPTNTSLMSEPASGGATRYPDFLRTAPAGKYPHITEFVVQRYLQEDYDYGDEFEFGLDLILDLLDRTREQAGPRRRRSQ